MWVTGVNNHTNCLKKNNFIQSNYAYTMYKGAHKLFLDVELTRNRLIIVVYRCYRRNEVKRKMYDTSLRVQWRVIKIVGMNQCWLARLPIEYYLQEYQSWHLVLWTVLIASVTELNLYLKCKDWRALDLVQGENREGKVTWIC